MMFNSKNKNQSAQEEGPEKDPFHTSDITYDNWNLFQRDRHILETRARSHDGVKNKFIWLFYWIGRSDCLSHKPLSYDIVYAILHKEAKNENSQYIEHNIANMFLIKEICIQNYTTGYHNALRESIHGIVNHPKKALKFKPENYKDPEFSSHDLMEMKIK